MNTKQVAITLLEVRQDSFEFQFTFDGKHYGVDVDITKAPVETIVALSTMGPQAVIEAMIRSVLELLDQGLTVEQMNEGAVYIHVRELVGSDDDVVCDKCGDVSESGWGDLGTCVDCSPADQVCNEHQRTFVDECPLAHLDQGGER